MVPHLLSPDSKVSNRYGNFVAAHDMVHWTNPDMATIQIEWRYKLRSRAGAVALTRADAQALRDLCDAFLIASAPEVTA